MDPDVQALFNELDARGEEQAQVDVVTKRYIGRTPVVELWLSLRREARLREAADRDHANAKESLALSRRAADAAELSAVASQKAAIAAEQSAKHTRAAALAAAIATIVTFAQAVWPK